MATVTVIAGSTGSVTGSGAARLSDTVSITVPTSGEQNKCLVVCINAVGSPSATYGGVAMSHIGGADGTCGNEDVFYLINPPTGTNNLVCTFLLTANSNLYMYATLADVLSLDVSGQQGSGSSNSVTKQITTTANGDMVMANCVSGGSTAANTWSATDIILAGTSDAGKNYFSYLAQTSSGNISGSYAGFGSQCPGIIVFSFKYQAPSSGPANMKTYNTNVKANIKTMNTNPLANVKTFDTNA